MNPGTAGYPPDATATIATGHRSAGRASRARNAASPTRASCEPQIAAGDERDQLRFDLQNESPPVGERSPLPSLPHRPQPDPTGTRWRWSGIPLLASILVSTAHAGNRRNG